MQATVAADFAGEFRKSIRRAVQNTERGQVVDILDEAVRIRIDFGMARRVFETVSARPDLIERNLDLIGLPHAPATWIEIDDRARRDDPSEVGDAAARIGFLVSRHPEDPGVLVVGIARQIPERAEGECHLMPAFCAINLASLADLAAMARSHLSVDPKESIARMVMHLRTYVPAGFTPELDEFAKVSENVDSDRLHTECRLETAGEGIFLLALLLSLTARNVVFGTGEDGARTASVATVRHGPVRRMLAALNLKGMGSVERVTSDGRTSVDLVDV